MTNKFLPNLLGFNPDLTSRQPRVDSLSILSRQSVLAILVVCLTMLGAGDAWATTVSGSYTFGNSSIKGWTCSPQTTYCGLYYSGKNSNFAVYNNSITNISGVDFSAVSSASITIRVKGITNSGTNSFTVSLVNSSGTALVTSSAQSNQFANSSNKDDAQWSGNIVLTPVSGVTGYKINCQAKSALAGTDYSLTYTAAACSAPTVGSALTSVSTTTNSITATVPISATGGCNITENGLVYSTSVATPTVGAANCTKVTTTACGGTAANKEVTITGLTCGTTYYVRGYATNSSGTSYTNVKTQATSACPIYTVTLMDDSDTRTQGSYGAAVTLPSRAGCTGYTFAGWTKSWVTAQSSWTSTAPTIISAGSYTPAGNENLYPVYTKTESGSGFSSYTKVTSAQDDWSGKYLISNGTLTATGSKFSSTALEVTTLTPGTTEYTSYEFTITKNGDNNNYFIITPDGENYVGYASSANLKFSTSTPVTNDYLWTCQTSDPMTLNVATTTRYIGVGTESATDVFKAYSTSGSNAKCYLYKRNEGGSTTYYISVPNCCTPLASINGSVSWSNGQATVSWDKLSGVRASTPYAVSVSPSAGVTVNSIDLTGANATCSVTGLTAGTAYTFTINAYGDASHCDKNQAIPSTAPQITVKSAPVALTGSDYAEGVSGGGTVKTFTVSGVGLTGALTFTAPTNFQVSTDNGSTWSTSGGSKTLAASGTLAETTIKARLVEGLSVGTYGGASTYITISGGGAAAVNSSVSITGTVSSACSVPTIGNPTLTSITGTTITVSCPTISGGTNCDVDEYGFIWKASSAPTMASYDGKKKTGENNQSTAYNDGLSIDVANNTGTTYHIKAYAHNSAGNNVSSTALTVTPRSVTFNLNGHGSSAPSTQYVDNGGKASDPSYSESVTGYTFGGWYKEAGCSNAWTFGTDVVSGANKTLYAKWTANVYTITKTFSNVANSGLPASFTYTGSTTDALNSSFTVDGDNFFLPSSITVTMGGTPLTQGTHYTYNNSTGAFTFSAVITGNIVITATAVPKLKSIAITAQPTTRAYLVGETFSKTGAVVTATMGDGTTKAVTASATWDLTTLSAGTSKTVTASYTEAGITKTATTTIDVYSVTVQKYDETPAEIVDAGVTVGANGRTLSQSVGSTKYVFNNWSLITASGMSISTNSLTGTPTGNVVVRANFYKPITITWLKGGLTYSTGTPTTEVSRGTLWSALTPPTDPGDATLGACATKFMGWSNNPAAEWTKEEHHTAPATLVKAAGFSSISTAITSDITFRAVFATASGSGGAAIGTTMWSEDFSSYSNPDEPSGSTNASNDNGRVVYNGGSVTYTCVAGNAATCVYENAMCGGVSPELLINKHKSTPSADGAFTIGGIPVGGAATLTLTYKMNNTNISQATTSTANVTVGDRTNPSATTYVQTITISGNVSTFDLTFTNSSSSNGRIDDISVVVATQNVTYSDYVTVCCTQYDITLAGSPTPGTVTGGTFDASAASACEGAEVTLSATPADGYSFAGWTVTKTASPYTDITSTNVDGNTLTMPDYGVTVNATFATLTGITVKTAPTKTTYCQGEYFDPTGLVITASFSNSTTLDIPYSGNEAKFTFSPNLSTGLTTGNTSVSITYGGQSTSQAITVNTLRTITLTGSGTVTGGTFTADNASACVGATITIEASAADHYSFTSWTIEKAGGGTVTPVSATSATTTFTMPDDNVTVTPTFTEAAFKTVVFKNDGSALFDDGGSASTYDGTNHWKQKVYVGEAPVTPTALRDGHGVGGDACNDESTSFYGWTKNTWDDVIETEASVKERTAANTVYKNGATLATVAAGDDAIIYYHAVWAKGDVVNINNPLIVKWNAQEINSTPTAGAKADGTESGAKISSNVTLGTAQGSYGYGLSDMGGSDITITITGLDFSGYNSGSISFYAKASQSRNLTIQESSGGDYSTLTSSEGTSSGSNGKWHEITGISSSTTSLKITYPTGATPGTFYIGTIRVYGVKSGTYTFTKLTSANTSGWTTSDWDGYYIIAKGTDASTIALNGGGIHGDCNKAVTVTDGTTISLTDPNMAFQITYEGTNEYSIRGVGSNDYINTSGAPVYGYYSKQTYYAVAYNELSATSSTYLRWNSNRVGVYSNQTQPTLYKILSVLTKFRTTCCEKLAVTKGGATPGTVTGGTFTVDKDEACEGETVAVSVTSTTTGYNFDHWTVTENTSGDAVTVTDGEFTMPDEAVTVTAVFAAVHTTTVTLDKQEGTGGTNSVTATVNLDMPAADMPTRSGYEFGGYYAAPNGSGTQYYAANGSSAHVWDDGENDNATLYAKWTASGYTVTLNNASAMSAGTPSVSVTYGANTNLTSAITCPEKTNKVFGGYYTGESGAGTRLIDQDGNWLPSVASYTDVNRNWLYANDLTLYAKWSDINYTNYRTTCGPEIEVTGGPVYLTSYPGCEVLTTGNITVSSENWQSTVGAPKFLSFQVKNVVTGETYSHTNSTIGNAGNEVRVYNAAGNGGSYADGGYIALPTDGTNPSYDVRIAYTPSASVYNTRDHYIILVKVYDNSGTKKTLTMETVDVYGRTLPEQFVIAAKKDGKWLALPNDLASGAATAKATKAVEIVVDNATMPTAALFAPDNTLYKATGYYDGVTVPNRNRSGIRFTRNGSQYLQISSTESNNNMWLSTTGGTDVQDWYLDGGTAFTSYTVKIDPRAGTGGYKDKKMGIFGSNFGFYSTPTAYDIYLLPVETTLEEASIIEWGKHSAIVEADAGSTGFNAATVIGRIGDEASTPIAVMETKTSYKGGATKYNYTINFGNTFDFTTEKGNKLYLDWLNSSGTVVATSMIDIPWIIDGTKTMSSDIDAVKGHWSSAEVHVLPGAVLTANAGSFESSTVTIGTLEIYPGATVKVTTGTLDVSDLVLRYGWTRASGKNYNSAQLQIKRGVGGANLTTTRAYADWYIDYDQFYSMSVPWKVATSDIRYRNTNSAANTSSVMIRYYDGEGRAETGQENIGHNWKNYNPWPEYLEPSKGYAISAKRPTGKAFSIIRMPLTIPSSAWTALGEQGEVSSVHKNQVSVTGWGKGSAEWYAMGWNFIGNPYMSTFNGDDDGISGKLELQNGGTIKYATIPDLGFHNYDQVAIADASILPASGFFIQANNAEAQNITFSADNIVAPSAPARFTAEPTAIPEQEAYIRLSYEGGKDQMGLIIGEDYTEAYEVNADLAKVLGDAGFVKTYMQYGGMDMAYVAINSMLAQQWIPVTVILPENGEYTFSLMSISEVEELEGVYLIDYANGEQVTNLIVDNYTFNATAGTISNRFAINAKVGERETPTDIDIVNGGGDLNSDKPFKFIYHEKVYIYHRGVIYDATGKKVR